MDGSDVFHMCLMDELKGQTCGEVAIAKWYVFKTSYFYYNPWPSFSLDDSGQNQQQKQEQN